MTIQPDKVTAQDTWMYTAKADVGRSVGIGIGKGRRVYIFSRR